MKNKLLFITFLFLFLLTPTIARAEIGGWSSSSPITVAADNTPTFGGLPVACAGNGTSILRTTLSSKRYIPVPAVYIAIKQYDAITGVEQELAPGKIFYNNFGTDVFYYTCTNGDAPTKVGCTGGDHCTDQHDATKYIISMFVLNYKQPTFEGTLSGKEAIQTQVELHVDNLAGDLNDGGLLKILLGTNDVANLNMAQIINGINSRMGTNLDINRLEDYYVSVEPVIRQYNSLVTLNPSAGGGFDLNGEMTGNEPNLDGGHYGEANTHLSEEYDCRCSGCYYGENTCRPGYISGKGFKYCPKNMTSGGTVCKANGGGHVDGYDVC